MNVLKIGRAPDNNLVIDDASVSRYHARIYNRSGKWYIVDLNSTHGTKINGKKTEGSVELKSSDKIILSDVELYFDGRAILSSKGKQLLVLNKPAPAAVQPRPGTYPPGRVPPGRAAAPLPKASKLPAIAGLSALLIFFVVILIAASANRSEPKPPDISSFPPPPQAVVEYAAIPIPYEGGEYTGWLRDGLPHGQGTLRYSAIGKSSAFVDLMVHRGTKARMYEGEWQYGFKHGYGKMTHPNGKVEEGYWEYGQFLGQSGN